MAVGWLAGSLVGAHLCEAESRVQRARFTHSSQQSTYPPRHPPGRSGQVLPAPLFLFSTALPSSLICLHHLPQLSVRPHHPPNVPERPKGSPCLLSTHFIVITTTKCYPCTAFPPIDSAFGLFTAPAVKTKNRTNPTPTSPILDSTCTQPPRPPGVQSTRQYRLSSLWLFVICPISHSIEESVSPD